MPQTFNDLKAAGNYVYSLSSNIDATNLERGDIVRLSVSTGFTAGDFVILSVVSNFDTANFQNGADGIKNVVQIASAEGIPVPVSGSTGGNGIVGYQAPVPGSTKLILGGMGDSRFAGIFNALKPLLETRLNLAGQIFYIDKSASGTGTYSYLNNDYSFAFARGAFKSAVAQLPNVPFFVPLMLGTNDAQTAHATSSSDFTSNMTAIMSPLIANQGAKFILNHCPLVDYTKPPAAAWDSQSNTRIQGYNTSLASLTNNGTILMGDTTSPAQINAATDTINGIHFDDAHSAQIAQLWLEPIATQILAHSNLGAPVAPSGGGWSNEQIDRFAQKFAETFVAQIGPYLTGQITL